MDGTDIGVGFNVGALWRPVKNLALGAVYRRGPRFDMTSEETDIFRDLAGNVIDTDSATAPFSFKVPDVIAAGVSYRFFERLTVAFEASYIFYSQLIDDFQVVVGNSRPGRHRWDDAVELHIGAEYVFFVKETPLAAQTQTRARLVDRAVMDKLLGELKLGSSALADPRTALQLGRVLSARVISVGTIAGSGPEWTLTMRMIETESSAVVASVAQSFPATQSSSQVADAVANDLAVKLRRAFPLRARVAGRSKGEVTLNVGSAEGAAVGQKLLILKDGERGGREAVAEVEIVEVSEHQSRARLSGEGTPISRGQRAIERT